MNNVTYLFQHLLVMVLIFWNIFQMFKIFTEVNSANISFFNIARNQIFFLLQHFQSHFYIATHINRIILYSINWVNCGVCILKRPFKKMDYANYYSKASIENVIKYSGPSVSVDIRFWTIWFKNNEFLMQMSIYQFLDIWKKIFTLVCLIEFLEIFGALILLIQNKKHKFGAHFMWIMWASDCKILRSSFSFLISIKRLAIVLNVGFFTQNFHLS